LAAVIGVILGGWSLARRSHGEVGGAVCRMAIGLGCGWSVLTARIMPDMEHDNTREMARQIRHVIGNRPVLFWGGERSSNGLGLVPLDQRRRGVEVG
jgi:hypothetical protein